VKDFHEKMGDNEFDVSFIIWMKENCVKCIERENCAFPRDNKLYIKRVHQVNELGFCEDYTIDMSCLDKNQRQVCQEEKTFDELWNHGQFPIDPELEDDND